MPDPQSSPTSDEPAPRSGSPTVVSTPAAASGAPAAKLPRVIAGIGLCGVLGFTLARLTLPPRDAAIECVQSALAATGLSEAESNLDVEIVMTGKLEVGGKRSAEIARGPLSNPIRRKAIESCRAVYARQTAMNAAAPLLLVDTLAASIRVRAPERRGEGLDKLESPAPGARVFVENLPAGASCVTSAAGECELTLRHLAHDAKLTIVAQLPNGVTVRKPTTALDLLRAGLTLEAPEHTPRPPPDCLAAGRRVEDAAQYTKIPSDAAGHELEAWVEVMSSGIVSDVQPGAGSDPAVMAALRLQLAGLRGLPGPCSSLRVSLHY